MGLILLQNEEVKQLIIKDENKCKTSNMLILSDSKGIQISCSEPIAGNHNDAYNLSNNVDLMLNRIKKSKINTDGLFLNADAGFDTKQFRDFCFEKDIIANICKNNRNGNQKEFIFDEKLYKSRFVIERTNAWLDAFKAILVRFETNKIHWEALNIIAFIVILLGQL